jgi:hypothetical protein
MIIGFQPLKFIDEEKSEVCACIPADTPHSIWECDYIFFYSFKNFTFSKIFLATFSPNHLPLSHEAW